MLTLMITGIFPGHGSATSTVNLFKGQSVYVPIYSHIYHGDRERPIDLAATLSIRNTDPKQEITLISADYFDSNGKLLKNYVKNPLQLKSLASIRYVIKSSDKIGGSGAKFIVRWKAGELVNPPVIEAIMISTASQLGISFISRGQVIKE
ncbi:DUF3124 domain-containing protein [Thermodesulfobacteriota bacterium]